jgi:hypothetical protein
MTFLDSMTETAPPPIEEVEIARPSLVPLRLKPGKEVGGGKSFSEVPYKRWFVFPDGRKGRGCAFPHKGIIMDLSFSLLEATEKNDNRLLNVKTHETYLVLEIIIGTPEEKIEDLVRAIGLRTSYR